MATASAAAEIPHPAGPFPEKEPLVSRDNSTPWWDTVARIYPEELGAAPTSEKQVHRALSQLYDDYLVIHGARWLGRPRRGERVKDGETDFVIAHADLGVLMLEVKGRRVSFDSATGSWTSVDRQGRSHQISDPFVQAMVRKHLLINKLREHAGWPRRRVNFGHGVCFPHVQVAEDLKPDAPREIIIDAGDLDGIEGALRRLFRYFDDGGPLGMRGVEIVGTLLAPTFRS